MLVWAAPISDETVLKAWEIFRNAMYEGHGQTEVLPVATVRSPQWFAKELARHATAASLRHAAALRRGADLDENNRLLSASSIAE
jgi:hypothetical protein